MVNAAQLRAARAWSGLSQEELAGRTGLTRQTIARLEQDTSLAQERTLRDLQRAFEEAGIEFVFRDGVGIGIHGRFP
jgi:transcriptional regulator with XRE-family HTH domain